MYHSFSSVKEDKVQDVIKSNKSKITKMIEWSVKYLVDLRANKKIKVTDMSIFFMRKSLHFQTVLNSNLRKEIMSGEVATFTAHGRVK